MYNTINSKNLSLFAKTLKFGTVRKSKHLTNISPKKLTFKIELHLDTLN